MKKFFKSVWRFLVDSEFVPSAICFYCLYSSALFLANSEDFDILVWKSLIENDIHYLWVSAYAGAAVGVVIYVLSSLAWLCIIKVISFFEKEISHDTSGSAHDL